MDLGLKEVLLLALPLTPALGALAVGLCPARSLGLLRALGWSFAILTQILWIVLHWLLPDAGGLLVSVDWPWVPDLGIHLHFGLDGAGIMMAGMIAFVSLVAVVGTMPLLPELSRSHLVCLLLAEGGMLGVATSWDLLLFIAFWEVSLVPFFLLMGRARTSGGVAAATRFFVTSMASSVLMWVGVLTLVGSAGEPRTFDLLELSSRVGCTPSGALVWLFAPAFLMRMAIVPLHTWFVSAQAEVPTAASIVLAGSILPLGGFGAAHLLPRLFGPTLGGAADVLLWLGLLAAAGGGLAAVVQRDLKRLLAYACLAQVGLALAGLVLPSPAAQQGGLMLLLAAGLGGASLFLYGGVVCHARSSQRIADIAGLWRSHPGFSGVAFAGFASVACLPGTVGFVGAWLVLQGMMGAGFVPVAVAASALVVVGGALLASYRRVCGGAFHEEMWSGERWPRKRQVTSLALLAAAILGAGLLPALFAPPPSELVPSCESRLLDDTLAQADSAGEALP